MLTTASQMFAFSIASSYKIFNFETLLKKIKYFFKPDISLLEEKLIKLEKNSNLPIFSSQERLTIENNITELKMAHKNQQNFKANKFNANLINNSESEPFIKHSSMIRETKLTLLL